MAGTLANLGRGFHCGRYPAKFGVVGILWPVPWQIWSGRSTVASALRNLKLGASTVVGTLANLECGSTKAGTLANLE